MMDNTTLDGNAAGGILREVFTFEMTLAEGTCAHCDATNAIGATTAYMSGMGTVLRCPSCEHVLIRIVSTRGSYWLDMQGLRALHIKPEL
jgi:hypothetical protein